MPSVNPVVEPEVIDPVCGMSILPADAVGQVTHRGQTYHFCSQSCLDKFQAAPEAYLNPAPAVPHGHDARGHVANTPARWIPRSGRSVPARAPSAGWRWSR